MTYIMERYTISMDRRLSVIKMCIPVLTLCWAWLCPSGNRAERSPTERADEWVRQLMNKCDTHTLTGTGA